MALWYSPNLFLEFVKIIAHVWFPFIGIWNNVRDLLLNSLPEKKQKAAKEVPVDEFTCFRDNVLNIQCSRNEDSTIADEHKENNESKSQRAEGHKRYYT